MKWFISIWSLLRIINAKYGIIRQMECSLPFAPYTIERHHLPFTSRVPWIADLLLPMIFIVPFYVLMVLAITSIE